MADKKDPTIKLPPDPGDATGQFPRKPDGTPDIAPPRRPEDLTPGPALRRPDPPIPVAVAHYEDDDNDDDNPKEVPVTDTKSETTENSTPFYRKPLFIGGTVLVAAAMVAMCAGLGGITGLGGIAAYFGGGTVTVEPGDMPTELAFASVPMQECKLPGAICAVDLSDPKRHGTKEHPPIGFLVARSHDGKMVQFDFLAAPGKDGSAVIPKSTLSDDHALEYKDKDLVIKTACFTSFLDGFGMGDDDSCEYVECNPHYFDGCEVEKVQKPKTVTKSVNDDATDKATDLTDTTDASEDSPEDTTVVAKTFRADAAQLKIVADLQKARLELEEKKASMTPEELAAIELEVRRLEEMASKDST